MAFVVYTIEPKPGEEIYTGWHIIGPDRRTFYHPIEVEVGQTLEMLPAPDTRSARDGSPLLCYQGLHASPSFRVATKYAESTLACRVQVWGSWTRTPPDRKCVVGTASV